MKYAQQKSEESVQRCLGKNTPCAAPAEPEPGSLPDVLNRRTAVQAQLELGRSLNQDTVQRFRVKATGEQRNVAELPAEEVQKYYGLYLTDALELDDEEEGLLITRFLDQVAGGDNDTGGDTGMEEAQTELQTEPQMDLFLPPMPVARSPVDKIAAAPLTKDNQVILGNSRAKKVHLFDADGNPTAKKLDATYMVDTGMDATEADNYEKARSWGVRVPEVYGRTQGGFPIVQWLSKQTTAGGAGARAPLLAVKQKMRLDVINKKPFLPEKWQTTLADVQNMIDRNYTSQDLQFMIDDDTGQAFIMDLEANNEPQIGSSPDKRLLELKTFLEKSIERGAPAL